MLFTGRDKWSVWIWKYISWGPKERDDIQSTTITDWSIQRQEASFNGSETREVGQQHMVNFFIVLVVHLVVYFCTANPSPMILYLTEPCCKWGTQILYNIPDNGCVGRVRMGCVQGISCYPVTITVSHEQLEDRITNREVWWMILCPWLGYWFGGNWMWIKW